MKKLLLSLVFLLAITTPVLGKEISFPDAGVSFVLPDNWLEMQDRRYKWEYWAEYRGQSPYGGSFSFQYYQADRYLMDGTKRSLSRSEKNKLILGELEGETVTINGRQFFRRESFGGSENTVVYTIALEGILHQFSYNYYGELKDEAAFFKDAEQIASKIQVEEVDYDTFVNRFKQDLGIPPSWKFPFGRLTFLVVLSLAFCFIPLTFYVLFSDHVRISMFLRAVFLTSIPSCLISFLVVRGISWFAVSVIQLSIITSIGLYLRRKRKEASKEKTVRYFEL